MKKFSKNIRHGIVSCLLGMTVLTSDLAACESSGPKRYMIEKDSLGRLIVLWTEVELEPALQISIDHGPSTVISLPGQGCLFPKLGITENNDLVVIWMALNKESGSYSLFYATLPFGGQWTKPVSLNADDLIIPKSHQLMVTNENEIDVMWEALTYSPSKSLGSSSCKNELRTVRCSINSAGGSPRTLARLYDTAR